ncbi:MAG: carboxypeptidase-like regulatory domain-containing protein [Vulcanimicrobiota bacterium]
MTKMAMPFWIILFCLAGLFFSMSPAAQAGTLTGKLTDDTGEPLDGISVIAYTGADPERYNAMPEELERAIKSKTDSNGAFSLTIPDSMPTFNLRIKVDTAYFNPLFYKDVKNESGTFQIAETFVATIINCEEYWVSSDANSCNSSSLSHYTNRWEQLKVRGKVGIPLFLPPPKIEPITVDDVKSPMPEIRGFPKRPQQNDSK